MQNQNKFKPITTKRYLIKYIATLVGEKWYLHKETFDMHKSINEYIERERINIFYSRKDIENYLTALIDTLIDEYSLLNVNFYTTEWQYFIFHYCSDEYNIR